jgi:hydroxyacylglutathione hydrolase
MQVTKLAALLKTADCPMIIDVRSRLEFRSGHIQGALHIPFWGALLLRSRLPKDKNAEIVLTCEHGPRAQLAAAQLGLIGYSRVSLLAGHMSEWRRRQLPVNS